MTKDKIFEDEDTQREVDDISLFFDLKHGLNCDANGLLGEYCEEGFNIHDNPKEFNKYLYRSLGNGKYEYIWLTVRACGTR